MYSLKGKAAFITGGTAGIGLAVARSYVQAGAAVIIAGRRDGDEIAREIGAGFYRLDVSDEQAVVAALSRAESELGKLNILVNNAGVAVDEALDGLTRAGIERIIEVNLKGVLYGLMHGQRHVKDGASIINTSSLLAVMGAPTQLVYAASKAAVSSMTRTAAIELGPRRIRVNAVLPGGIMTEMAMPPALMEALAPIAREGTVDDLVGIYNLLASDASAYISGQNICVDGGLSAGTSTQLMGMILGGAG